MNLICAFCGRSSPVGTERCACNHQPGVTLGACSCSTCSGGQLVLYEHDAAPPPPPPPPPDLTVGRLVKVNPVDAVRRVAGLVPLRRPGGRT